MLIITISAMFDTASCFDVGDDDNCLETIDVVTFSVIMSTIVMLITGVLQVVLELPNKTTYSNEVFRDFRSTLPCCAHKDAVA